MIRVYSLTLAASAHCCRCGLLYIVLTLSEVASAIESLSSFATWQYPTRVYWGDTHVHTALSVDANAFGNKKITPPEAYQLARGDMVYAHNGMQVRLRRPLDFLVVADHDANMGVMRSLEMLDPLLLRTQAGKRLYKKFKQIQDGGNSTSSSLLKFALIDVFLNEENNVADNEYRSSVWHYVTSMADQYNDPGKFTAFIGYEWTPLQQGSVPHRVVIFKDNADKANQVVPFSARVSSDPEDLWRFLARYEAKTGGEILAIPHNPNLSNGTAFSLTDINGQPMSLAYAKQSNRWEPLLEVTQFKGDSETHPVLSPTDEFADYETWDPKVVFSVKADTVKSNKRVEIEKKQYEYARSGLKLGLKQQTELGVNPFKFGLIGSTDSHTGFSTADENNFWGIHAIVGPGMNRINNPPERRFGWRMNASGYVAVWARENTRESLFAAMKRKETYATTGPRMNVRFFGGWEYDVLDADKPDLGRIGYMKGVPMGGDLTNAPGNKAPSFLISATKDPDGANLDRVQVIKGWRDEQGKLHETVYNVALSDCRKKGLGGTAKPVGNTVDVKGASYTNTIGAPELVTVWKDPAFNKNELAFYYVRVLEIPTPRWTAYDAKFFGLRNISDDVPMITQERAYTSPIWYSP